MSDLLARMAAESRRRVRDARMRTSEAALLRRASTRPKAPALDLGGAGFGIIAEIKFRSPSSGSLRREAPGDAVGRAIAYERGGASAVSVVTEPSAFGGSLEALSEVADGCGLPAMRKDFIVDPYQVVEAKAHGAAGVLLIVRILDAALLRELIASVVSLDLFALIEAFDRDDLDRGCDALARSGAIGLLGVNARDLATLSVDRSRHARLVRAVPERCRLVAESGIRTPDDAAEVAALGYRAALVGEALMALDDPRSLLEELVVSGRKAAAARGVTR